MLADIGLAALTVSFFLGVYAIVASAYGGLRRDEAWTESARNASLLVVPFMTAAVLVVAYALYTLDFSLAYVAEVSSRAMSPFLRLAALWGGQAGSILFWAWLMSGFVGAVLWRKWEKDRELMPYFITTAVLTTTFFVGIVLFITNPFARLWHLTASGEIVTAISQPAGTVPFVPQDGNGLNPLLRHFGMIGHPPTTYLGFTGFVIPFAFAISALITGKSRGDQWIRTSRRWTLVAWIFLSIGLVLGGRWAYDVLGWGGFWGWDPVENAMLMPWLTGTAFLHSVMITEKRGMLKMWSVILIILTYSLSLFGTFITRTGVISSVHSFSKTALGPVFFVFIAVTFIGSVWLLLRRRDTLRTEHELQSFVSREAAFLLQNLLFLAITFVVFLGTVFPLLSEAVTGTKITVGPPYFQKAAGPLFAALVLLMATAPLFAWRKQAAGKLGRAALAPFAGSLVVAAAWGYAHRMHPASYFALWVASFVVMAILFEFYKGVRARMKRGENPLQALARLVGRNHRRYGGYVIHLGVMMIGLAFIGDVYFQEETQRALARGESMQLGAYELRFEDLEMYPGSDGREVLEATTSLYKDGQFLRTLHPRRDFFVVQQQPVTIPAVYTTLAEDIYVLLVGWEEVGLTSSTFKIYRNPLIIWAWVGGLVLILGTGIAVWPQARGRRQESYALRPAGGPRPGRRPRRRPAIRELENPMKRIGTLLFLLITMTLAVVPAVKAQDGVSDDEVNAVAKKLYCPVCPNTPLDVCETQACKDWRAEIRDQLSAGWSEEEVMAYFVERYGERVLAEPQRGGFTSLVWILPVVAILLGLVVVAQALRSWRNRRGEDAGDDAAVVRAGNVAEGNIAPEARARIERELQEML